MRGLKGVLYLAGILCLLASAGLHAGEAEGYEEENTYIKEEREEQDFSIFEPISTAKQGTVSKEPEEAAGPVIRFTQEEQKLLMKIAQAEAGNQGEEGMWLVMSVVMNRVESADYPDTIEEVIFQESQFSSVADGNFDNAVIISAEAQEAYSRIENGDIAPLIIGFEVKTSQELDKYFLAAFEYRDHRFYTKRD